MSEADKVLSIVPGRCRISMAGHPAFKSMSTSMIFSSRRIEYWRTPRNKVVMPLKGELNQISGSTCTSSVLVVVVRLILV
jgi:hypothetical protein